MTTGVSGPRPFRGDIAGLRAVAVIAVVLYHFGVPGFKGGFSGVDIFFVISGYLMTQIISTGIDQNKFDLLQFYLARARRIIPALAVLCLVLMAAGWVILVPVDYLTLGRGIVSSMTFLSNIEFWKASNAYFNIQQRENWLLHTWSLSVEWQFYLAFPVLMLVLKRLFGLPTLRLMIVLVALVSLGLSIYMSPRWPNISFYTPITRGWEMLAGSIIFLFPVTLAAQQRRVMELLGLVVLACSIFLLRPSNAWPGYMALIPVIGASLVLIAANPTSYLARSRVLLSLGDASYSIYLWHWPVAVYLAYTFTDKTPLVLAVAIPFAVALGYLSLYLVERPTRHIGVKHTRALSVAGYGVLTSVVAALGASIFLGSGYPWRASDTVNMASKEGTTIPIESDCTIFRGLDTPKCVLGVPGAKVSVIVLGDSHAEFSASAVAKAAGKGNGALLLTYVGCMVIPDVKLRDGDALNRCGEFMRDQIINLRSEYDGVPVVVINRFSRYSLGHNEDRENPQTPMAFFDKPSESTAQFKAEFAERYVAGICDLATHHPVFITAPTPEIGVNVSSLVSRSVFWRGVMPPVSITRAEYDHRNQFAMATINRAVQECGAVVLDPLPYLCNKDTCNGVENDVPLYYDDNHLSTVGVEQLVPMYRQIWNGKLASGS